MQNLDNKTYLTTVLPRYNTWLTDAAIKKTEETKNAKFVGEFPVRPHSTVVGALFYQPSPPPTYSPYFFLYVQPSDGQLYITSGAHVVGKIYQGAMTPSGEFIYSRGRHDFIERDGVIVDGGDAYMRSSLNAKIVYFQVQQGQLVLMENMQDEPRTEEAVR